MHTRGGFGPIKTVSAKMLEKKEEEKINKNIYIYSNIFAEIVFMGPKPP